MQALRYLWIGFLGLLRFGVFWIPATLMAIMGLAYLWVIYDTLLAPGVGIDLTYKGSGGNVRLTSDSFSIDPIKRSIVLSGATVTNPDGEESVWAQRLVVRQTSAGSIDVRITDSSVKLTRKPDGALDALDLLPPPSDKEGTPVVLRVNQVEIEYIDRSRIPLLVRKATLNDLVLNSAKKSVVASGGLDVRNAGKIDLLVHSSDQNLKIDFSTDQFDVSEIRDDIERWLTEDAIAHMREYRFGSFNLKGDGTYTLVQQESHWNGEFQVDSNRIDVGIGGEWNQLNGRLRVRDLVFLTNFQANGQGKKIDWDGGIDLTTKPRVIGEGEIFASNKQVLGSKLVKYIPQEVEAKEIDFNGSVSWSEENGLTLDGKIKGRSAGWREYVAQDVEGDIHLRPGESLYKITKASYQNSPVTGWVALKGADNQLSGSLESSNFDLGKQLAALDIAGTNGSGSVDVILAGTANNPTATANFVGSGSYAFDGKNYSFGSVLARVDYAGENITIKRGVLLGEYGNASLEGDVSLKNQQVNLELHASGIDLATFSDQVSGIAFSQGLVSGSFKDIRYDGNIKAFNLEYQERSLPIAEGLVSYADQEILLSQVQAVFGLGKANGQLAINLEEKTLNGDFSAFDLYVTDFVEAEVVGRFDLDSVKIGGTFDEPSISFTANAAQLIAYGQKIDTIHAKGSLLGSKVELSEALLTNEGGSVSVNGTYEIDTQVLDVQGEVDQFDLSSLKIESNAVIEGEVSGPYHFKMNEEGIKTGTWNGQVGYLAVNGFELGGGVALVSLSGDDVSADVSVGSPAGFFELTKGIYNIETKKYSANVVASTIGVEETLVALGKSVDVSNPKLQAFLDNVTGIYNADAKVEGGPDGLIFNLNSLTLNELHASNRPIGEMTIQGGLDGDKWSLRQFEWKNGESLVSANGSGVLDGNNDLQGQIINFDPSLLTVLGENVPEIHAGMTMFWELNGPWEKLSGQTSLQLTDISYRDGDGHSVQLPVNINTEGLTLEDGVISLVADLTYAGIEATLSGSVPIEAFYPEPETQAVLTLNLPDRDIDTFKDYIDFVDWENSTGQVGGMIRLIADSQSGEIEGSLAVKGIPGENGANLKLKELDSGLKNLILNVNLDENVIKLDGYSESLAGGEISLEGSLDVGDMLDGEFSQYRLKETPLDLSIAFADFTVDELIQLKEKDKNNNDVLHKASKNSHAVVNGMVNLNGPLATPIVSGDLIASDVFVSLPSSFPAAKPKEDSVFNPTFSGLNISLDEGSKLEMLVAEVALFGTSRVSGSFNDIQLQAPFTVQDGELDLPTARVNIEEGGQLTVIVDGATGDMRVDVNLEGTSVVTVRQTSDRYETYSLNLQMRGNLLDPEGVNITGTSDPPDLSQEQIQAIIGQKDFIENIAASALGNQGLGGLQQSLFSYAIPSLTAGFTDDLAKALKLDYLVLDYNPFDQAMLRGGKTISKGLMFEFERQLFAPSFGRQKFEVKFSYRVPALDRYLSRMRFSVGIDESFGWKAGVNYSIKF